MSRFNVTSEAKLAERISANRNGQKETTKVSDGPPHELPVLISIYIGMSLFSSVSQYEVVKTSFIFETDIQKVNI